MVQIAQGFPRKRRPAIRIPYLFLLLPIFLGAGCGTLSNGRGWGEDAIYPVQLGRIPRAAYHALVDWQTLVPTAGTILFRINHYDQKVSDWATDHHPVFRSERAARSVSDYILAGLYGEVFATAIATPSGNNVKEWTCAKVKGLTVEGIALGVTSEVTAFLQRSIDRTRPDGSDSKSFPSSHASTSFGAATLSNRNLDFVPLPNEARIPIQVGNIVLAAADSWARVEGKEHFPSDVLAGAALGHFLTAFIHDAFLGLPERAGLAVSITPARGGALGLVSFSF